MQTLLKMSLLLDDIPLVVKNRQIRQLSTIPELLGMDNCEIIIDPHMVSYAIDYHYFKLNPLKAPPINILLHTVTASLVFSTLYRLSNNYTISLAASLLFIIHPVQTDSVAFLAGRRISCHRFFTFLAFTCLSAIEQNLRF